MRGLTALAAFALASCAAVPKPFIAYTLPSGWTAALRDARTIELRGPDDARVVMSSRAGEPESHADVVGLKRATWDGNGRDARPIEKAVVAGAEIQIWRRESHLQLEPSAATTYFEDEFLVVPRRSGFALLHYSRESQGTPYSPQGEARRAEWRALLESIH
jgi:hypothetical protein